MELLLLFCIFTHLIVDGRVVRAALRGHELGRVRRRYPWVRLKMTWIKRFYRLAVPAVLSRVVGPLDVVVLELVGVGGLGLVLELAPFGLESGVSGCGFTWSPVGVSAGPIECRG